MGLVAFGGVAVESLDSSRIERHDRPSKTVLAVASGGGHWEQLMLLRPALEEFQVDYATTNADLAVREGFSHVHKLPDSNRNRPLKALECLWVTWQLVRSLRPDVVITTGALPGLLALIAGRVGGSRTIWIDSVANSERPSTSGKIARHFATLWLTQWEHLARPGDPEFEGALL